MVLNFLRSICVIGPAKFYVLLVAAYLFIFSANSFADTSVQEDDARPSLLDKLYPGKKQAGAPEAIKPTVDKPDDAKESTTQKDSSPKKKAPPKKPASKKPVEKAASSPPPKKNSPQQPPKKTTNKSKAQNNNGDLSNINIAGSKVTLEPYPRRFQFWLLDVVNADGMGDYRCVLKSNETIVSDGYLETFVSLEVYGDMVVVSAQSPIDLSYPGLGVRVDSFDLISFDAVISESKAAIFLDRETLVTQMKLGDKLMVTLGFWPVFPVDKTYTATIDLKGFVDGLKKFPKCEKSR